MTIPNTQARWEIAEARVRELEALRTTAESESRAQRQRADDWETIAARDFQLAADWKARFEAAEADATVAKDRLAALRARVEAALKWADDGLEGEALAYHMVEALRG